MMKYTVRREIVILEGVDQGVSVGALKKVKQDHLVEIKEKEVIQLIREANVPIILGKGGTELQKQELEEEIRRQNLEIGKETGHLIEERRNL